MAAIDSPFAADGLQPAIAARDQKIALLEYKLRCAEADLTELSSQLSERNSGTGGALANGSSAAPSSSSSSASSSSLASIAAWLGSDEEGSPISGHERRTLNALVRRYLLARGYKQAAVSLAEEVTDQDLGPTADDSDLVALPGARRRGGGAGGGGAVGPGSAPVLSLLSMHRKRIAPIQALVESEARNDSALTSLRGELKAREAEIEVLHSELQLAREKIAALEQEVVAARSAVAAAAKAGAIVPTSSAAAAPHQPAPSSSLPPPHQQPQQIVRSGPGGNDVVSAGSGRGVALAHAPALLKVLQEGVPVLMRHIVTRHRATLVPILGAAAAAEGAPEGRRALLQRMLTFIRRPTHAERHLIRTQVAVLAGKLGPSGVEAEILPEVFLLSKTGKTKERKALAAVLAGGMAPFVSDKRCDGLLATLTDLSESPHAIVRVGVVEGLTALAQNVADRWARALASGAVMGSATAIEAFSQRQFGAVEELMWKCLLGGGGGSANGGGGGGGAGTEDNDAAELEAAAAAEFPLGLPPALALFGVPPPPGAAAPPATAASSSANGGKPGSPASDVKGPTSLPPGWGAIPPNVATAVCASLVPVLVAWSYRLGCLWSRFLPGLLTMLAETLHSSPNAPQSPAGGSSGQGPNAAAAASSSSSSAAATAALLAATGLGTGKAAASVRLTEWHQRRSALILSVLQAAAGRVRAAVFDEGYSIEMIAQAASQAAAAAAQPQANANSSTNPFANSSGSSSAGAGKEGGSASSGSGSSEDSEGLHNNNSASAGNAAPSTTAGASGSGNNNGDFVYELFDFSSQAAITSFPPAEPVPGSPQPPMPAQQRQALILSSLLRGTVAVRRRKNAPPAPPAAASAGSGAVTPVTWQPVRDEYVAVAWPSLRYIVRSLVPVLIRQAACVNRSSSAGRAIVDAYAETLSALGVAFGPAFTSLAIRPLFLRAFGIPCDLPPPPPAGGPAAGGAGATAAAAAVPGIGQLPGRKPSLILFSQVLYGLPLPAKYAPPSAAAMTSAAAAVLPPVNFTQTGPTGGDWPVVMPELGWLSRDSGDNPANWSGRGPAAKAAAAQHADPNNPSSSSAAAAPGPSTGGAWNADALLPLFGSGVLACPSLFMAIPPPPPAAAAQANTPQAALLAAQAALNKEALEHALRALIVIVATGRMGWGGAQASLEDCVMRAGGGNSLTSSGGGAGGGGRVTIAVGAGAASYYNSGGVGKTNLSSPRQASSVGGSAVSSTADASSSDGNANSPVLHFILTDVLARASTAGDAAIRCTVAGLYRSLIPLLSPEQLRDPFLPTIRRLSSDKDPSVVKAAVRALATVYSSPAMAAADGPAGAGGDVTAGSSSSSSAASVSAAAGGVRGDVNAEVSRLLGTGPKDVIVEILRALMRAVPNAPPSLRDEFILDRLLEMNAAVVDAAQAGAEVSACTPLATRNIL